MFTKSDKRELLEFLAALQRAVIIHTQTKSNKNIIHAIRNTQAQVVGILDTLK